MSNLIYSNKYLIESTHVDTNKKLSIPSFYLFIQDLSIEHAELIGIGSNSNLAKNNKLWVFASTKFEFYDMPNYLEEIKLATYPGERKAFIFNRYYEMRDKEDKILARGSSSWAIIDSISRRLELRPDVVDIPSHHEKDELSLPERIVNNDELTLCYEKDIMYCDCDLNSHLNNTRYIELIVNINHLDFYKENRIKTILVNYLKEIKDGEHIKIFTNKDKTFIRGICNDVICFEAELTYTHR